MRIGNFGKCVVSLLSAMLILIITCMWLKVKELDRTYAHPASVFEIGDIVADDYRVYATDNEATLWLQSVSNDKIISANVNADGYYTMTLKQKMINALTMKSCQDEIEINIESNMIAYLTKVW